LFDPDSPDQNKNEPRSEARIKLWRRTKDGKKKLESFESKVTYQEAWNQEDAGSKKKVNAARDKLSIWYVWLCW
jgi:hypothetical protein